MWELNEREFEKQTTLDGINSRDLTTRAIWFALNLFLPESQDSCWAAELSFWTFCSIGWFHQIRSEVVFFFAVLVATVSQ